MFSWWNDLQLLVHSRPLVTLVNVDPPSSKSVHLMHKGDATQFPRERSILCASSILGNHMVYSYGVDMCCTTNKHMSLWLDLLREGIERDKHKEIDDKERKAER